MPIVFAVYNLKPGASNEEYEAFLKSSKTPGFRSQSWCTAFNTWRIDQVLGPAVAELQGELPKKSPYTYVAKIEASDLDAMNNTFNSPEGQTLVKAWSKWVDPTSFMTAGREVGI